MLARSRVRERLGDFGLPFHSGHVLALLRLFSENDFGPYRTVWHRDPGGCTARHHGLTRTGVDTHRHSTRILGILNAARAAMPLATWSPRSLLWVRERLFSCHVIPAFAV